MNSASTDYPEISSSTYGDTSKCYGMLGACGSTGALGWDNTDYSATEVELLNTNLIGNAREKHERLLRQAAYSSSALMAINAQQNQAQQQTQTKSMKRIVRVYLVDPDDRVPVENSILHQTEDKATDLTDQELYFELPVVELLKAHNAKRQTIVDKKASDKYGKEVFLDPVKIRDLKMQVVVIAAF